MPLLHSHWYLGQVWYLIISIPDLCTLTYFGSDPEYMFLSITSAITGERQFAANFIIFRPMPSNPVAIEVSSEVMTENTCSLVMQGISKYVLSGTLLLTYSMSFVRSNWFVPVLLLFKILAIDEKYSFKLDAIVLES